MKRRNGILAALLAVVLAAACVPAIAVGAPQGYVALLPGQEAPEGGGTITVWRHDGEGDVLLPDCTTADVLAMVADLDRQEAEEIVKAVGGEGHTCLLMPAGAPAVSYVCKNAKICVRTAKTLVECVDAGCPNAGRYTVEETDGTHVWGAVRIVGEHHTGADHSRHSVTYTVTCRNCGGSYARYTEPAGCTGRDCTPAALSVRPECA